MFPSKSCNNCILFPVGNLNVELMTHSTYGGGVGSGRVRLFVGNRGSGRVGSGQRFAGSDRVGSKKSDPWTTLVYGGWRRLYG